MTVNVIKKQKQKQEDTVLKRSFDSIFMFRMDEEECIIPATVLTMHCIIHSPHKASCTSAGVCV